MNERQKRALELMRDPDCHKRRELYEGASTDNSRLGSGEYWITYKASRGYEPLTKQDVDDLLACGLIKEKWPGCYELAGGKHGE